MYVLISIVMAIAPSIILVQYFYNKDKKKPEPKGLIFKIFVLGILFTIPTISLELLVSKIQSDLGFPPFLNYFVKAFIVAALCEEFFKLAIVIHFAYNRVEFDEVMDGIVYMVVASLGFACMENVLYVIGGGIGIAILRAFTAVPLHALASGIMGYFIGKAKFATSKKSETYYVYKGLLLAVIIHGVYDFLLFAAPELRIFSSFGLSLLLISSFIVLRNKIKLAITHDSNNDIA